MSYSSFLRNQYFKLNKLNIKLECINTIRLQSSEDFNHSLAKFLVCIAIHKNGHHFKTEQRINDAICDVIDLDNLIIYEIESDADMTKRKKKLEDFYHPYIEDIIIIDLKKIEGLEKVESLFRSIYSRYVV